MTKKEIFTLAWKAAKNGAKKFGGSSRDYFAESLRLVYQTASKVYALRLAKDSWVALLTGTDPKFNFSRRFLNSYTDGLWILPDGIYNYKAADEKEQRFVVVENLQLKEINKFEAKKLIDALINA